MRIFPSDGCRQAFECGKDYVIAGGTIEDVAEALTFCETPREQQFFLLGCAEESLDLEDMELV